MDNLHGILVFLRVVEAGSLSSAARSLGVSTSAVSASLARLESRLRTRLVNRTTRRLKATGEGDEFYQRCKKIVSDLEAAELLVGQAGQVPAGPLRVGVPSALGKEWIVPRLGGFIADNPAVSLEIVCTDFVPYTISEALDVAVQIGDLHDSTLAVRRLACSNYVTCASPQYLKSHGTPRTPSDLSDHRCITYRRPRNGLVWDWRYDLNGTVHFFPMQGIMIMNSHGATVWGAAAGLGIIQVADYYAHAHIQRGELIEILPEFKTDGHIISAVFPKQEPFPPKIRAFVDFLARQFDRPPWSTREADTSLRIASNGGRAAPMPRLVGGRDQPALNRERSGRGRKPSEPA
jgi:LysR family transcriptional regulator for bpeEF and oprC